MTDSTSVSPSGRIAILDFLRGMAMVLVILGHSQFPYDKAIMAFHMPLFFFLSGITTSLKPARPFGPFITTRLRKLLLPYLSFEVIALILSVILCRIHHDPINLPRAVADILLVRHSVGAAAHTGIIARFWFFPCIFFASLINYPIQRYGQKLVWKSLYMCFCWIVGYCIYRFLPGILPLTLDIAFVAAGFIMLGSIFADTSLSLLKEDKAGRDLLGVAVGIAALFLSVKYNPETVSFFVNQYGSYGWMLVGSIGGILAAIITFKYLFRLLQHVSLLSRAICMIGFLSLAIFPVHLLVLYFLEHIHPFHWSILFAITLLVSPLIAWLIKRFLPILIGEKRQNPRSYAGK